jgi:DNA-binding transcriptional LysR family regulator
MQELITPSRQTDWDDLRHFLEAARTGSFRSAAVTLGTTQPTVGRRVERLERRLGTKLLRRVAHGVRMTPSGEAVFKMATDIDRLMRQIELQAAADRSLAGRIRLWVTDGIGGYWLPPRLVEFHKTHPEITIEVICSNDIPDLTKMEADIVVTYEKPTNPNLVVLARASIDFRPFASREYLQYNGTPRTLADLQQHRICDHTEYPRTGEWQAWADIVRDHPCVSYRTNSSITLGHNTLYGAGISLQPVALAGLEPNLVMLDLDGYTPRLDFWLVCHRENKDIPRMRALIDHLKTTLFAEKMSASVQERLQTHLLETGFIRDRVVIHR